MKSSKPTSSTKKLSKKSISADTQERLLTVGRSHFLRFGSKRLAIRAVAEEAGVNLGSFVYHFRTKEAFIEAVITSHYHDFLKIFSDAFSEPIPDDSPKQKMTRLLNAVSQIGEKQGALVMRLLMDIFEGDKTVLKIAQKRPPAHVKLMLEVIQDCQAGGVIRSDLDARQVYFLIVASIALPRIFLNHILKNLKNKPVQALMMKLFGDGFSDLRVDFVRKGLMP